ncbi:Jasmonate O-methyltransferase [Citrus sinensis]|nr:Jasmonate O-methyltransferase [Citrus sinensis]
MEVMKVLHMNKGDGENSYANNSAVQGKIITTAKPVIEEAILGILCETFPESIGIADLGCSSGPNSLLVISEIIDIIHAKCRNLGRPSPEFRVSLNDLPGNDFNSIFESLPAFFKKQKQEKGIGFGRCYISGVAGSFYDRLFPDKSLHFVHSSSSLHWLSQVPPALESNATPGALNKGKIYISKSSPQCVLDAYSLQFQNNFLIFLKSRAAEMIAGGRMVLSLMGRRSIDPTTEESCYQWELLAQALMSLVTEMGPGHRVTKRVRAEIVVASTIPQSQPVMSSQEFVQEALKHSYPGICPDDWAWLCHNIYNSASFQTQSTKKKANRAKLPYVHCGGSRPFVNYLEDDMVDGEIELFRVTHFSKTKGWVNEVAHLNHDQMVEIQQQQQIDPQEAKPLTQREICIEVLGKKSGYFRGLGNGPRPTSNHGVDTSEADRLHGIISSQQSRLDSQDVELQEQKKTIDQLESRLSQFEEEKLDSFNAPYYAPCPEELKMSIQKEGSFIIDRLGHFEIDWDGGVEELTNTTLLPLSRGQRVAKTVRAVVESMFELHFGKGIMDLLFARYAEMVDDYLSKNRAKYINLVISIIKKDN